MSVQRWDIERGAPAWVASKGEFVKYADHARIVGEITASVDAVYSEYRSEAMIALHRLAHDEEAGR